MDRLFCGRRGVRCRARDIKIVLGIEVVVVDRAILEEGGRRERESENLKVRQFRKSYDLAGSSAASTNLVREEKK